jgi:hypothetical protein
MLINFTYDNSVGNAPAGFLQGLAAAANIIDTLVLNPITITIDIGYGEDNGQALSGNTLGEAQPAFGMLLSYSELLVYLRQADQSNGDTTGANSFPTADPANGGNFFVSAAQLIAWGIIPGPETQIDGYAGFSSTLPFTYDPTNGVAAGTYDFVGVALHELTHALGRYVAPSWPTSLNLFGYGANGLLDLNNTDPRYFSIDGGKTPLVNFDTTSDQADFASNGPVDPFDAAIPAGTRMAWTNVDTEVMTALGYQTTPPVPAPLNFTLRDTATGQKSTSNGDVYTGPAAGINHAFIAATPDAMNITANVSAVFIQGGSGNTTISAANAAGHNILEGGSASNRLVGSINPNARDTFIVNDLGATADTWNTIVDMHFGDSATVLGISPSDFTLKWTNGPGAIGSGALTLQAAKIGGPTESLILMGFTMADLSDGRLNVSFSAVPGTNSMSINVLA